MAEQERAQPQSTETDEVTDEAAAQNAGVSDVAERHATLGDEIDDLLDEIDDVLETNAAEFVQSFVQKGGE
jgi:ubiquitin-like protein Pup